MGTWSGQVVRMYAPIWSSMVGCFFLGRGVLTPHWVFQVASVLDGLYFGFEI